MKHVLNINSEKPVRELNKRMKQLLNKLLKHLVVFISVLILFAVEAVLYLIFGFYLLLVWLAVLRESGCCLAGWLARLG
jgi:predicted PurR-regulated permease PerM